MDAGKNTLTVRHTRLVLWRCHSDQKGKLPNFGSKVVRAKRNGSAGRIITSLSTLVVEKGERSEEQSTSVLLVSAEIEWNSALENRKGCDIGYAPAICSCEEANSVDTCTVAALDAITAFAVPNPNCSSQSQSVFSGPVALQVTP